MNKLLNTLFGLSVACATTLALAQAPAPAASSAAPAAPAATAQTAPAAQPLSPKSLEAKIAMCIGCHGIKGYRGSFPEVYRVPMIAGQNAKYIAAALHAYQSGDRKHPTMRSVASSLSDQDINDIANYYANAAKGDVKALGEKPNREPDAEVGALIQKAACFSCHGANLSKPIDPSYPKISGQYPDYVFVALKAYKTQGNPNFGRNNGVMGAIAKQFSFPELKALANYVGSLDTELETKTESRIHHD
jgi:cytochrome c553